MTKKLIKSARIFFLFGGGILLAILIKRTGLQTILDDISSLGFGIVWIFMISSMWYVFYTMAWRQFLARLGNGIGFLKLLRIKIAGEAINTLTPASFLGGDPFRIHLLKKNFALTEGAASVVVDRTLHSIATLLVIITGVTASFLTFKGLPANIKYGVPIVTVVAAVFMAFVLMHQHKGFFSLLLALCKRLHIKRRFSDRTVARFEELDSHIIDFYEANHRGFWLALLYHTVGRFLGVLEIYIIGRYTSDDFTLFASLLLCALAPVVNAVFTFIPGALGVMEGAYSGLLYLMHLDPAIGMSVQITRRLRSACWIAIGLIFIGTHDRKEAWKEELIEEV